MSESIQRRQTSDLRLAQLPFPVNFVHPYHERWMDVLEATDPPDPDLIASRFARSNDVWIVKTYLRLRERSLNVRLRTSLVPDAINVIASSDLGIRQFPYDCYIVSCRADTFRPTICHHTIVQNPCIVYSAADHFVQHWPQPGLIPRDVCRDARVETVFYMGYALNLWSAFQDPSFEQRLAELGMTFRINQSPNQFHDYSECDVLLAVRDLTESDYLAKPASKLINAWHAGVPALLGPEPAFQVLRKCALDYIEIKSPEDAVRAIVRLKQTPDLYRRMVENGRMRAQEFTVDRLAARWRDILAGPVAEGFAVWRRRPAVWKTVMRPTVFATQAVRNLYEKRKYVRQRDHGFRPVSGRVT